MNPISVNPAIAISAARQSARAEAVEAGRRRRRQARAATPDTAAQASSSGRPLPAWGARTKPAAG